MDDPCRCGHERAAHYRRFGVCLHSSPTAVFACQCVEWRRPHWWVRLVDWAIVRRLPRGGSPARTVVPGPW